MIIEHGLAPLGIGWILYRKYDNVFIRDASGTSYRLYTEREGSELIIFFWDYLNAVELYDQSEDPEYLPPVLPLLSVRHLRKACTAIGLTLRVVKDD